MEEICNFFFFTRMILLDRQLFFFAMNNATFVIASDYQDILSHLVLCSKCGVGGSTGGGNCFAIQSDHSEVTFGR